MKGSLKIISGKTCSVLIALGLVTGSVAQDSSALEVSAPQKIKPVKNTFESAWIIDNQTVMVPVKKTFEMDIQHRFGTIENGYDDFWGLFAPSNIRLGFTYAPINKLNVGVGITKSNMLWDASAKYAIVSQTKTVYPVSATYFCNVSYDTRKDKDGSLFRYRSDRLLFFHQLILARKFTEKVSLQLAPSLSHQNAVFGYYQPLDSMNKIIKGEMKHDHFALAISGRFKLTNVTSVLANVDQPLTKHKTNNPNPNLSLGLEFSTGSHAFQVFLGNYFLLSPQRNNLFNKNDYQKSKYLIGFNITRLWNY